MIKTIGNYLLVFLLIFLCMACWPPSGKVERLLDTVESIVEQQPDSAFALLRTIWNPEDLKASQKNKYLLLQIQAKDKSYRDISSDTIICAVKEYYVHKKDFPNAALAAFYCGQVLQELQKIEEAADAYLKAEKLAEQIDNDNLKGLIQGNLCSLYQTQFLNDKAIFRGKNAIHFYHKAQNYKNEISALLLIGNCFLLENETDNAFYYYNRGLKLADAYQLTTEQANARQNIGVAYRETREYSKAKKSFREALFLRTDSIEQARILMNIAKTCSLENQMDSAKSYIEQSLAIQAKESGLLRSTYHLLSEIEEKEGHYQEALQQYKNYTNQVAKVVNENKNKALLELQEKYDFESIQNRNNQLALEKQKLLLTALFVFIAISLIVFFFYRKSVQDKRTLVEVNQKIESLKKMADTFSKEKQSFRNTLLDQFDILKKVALINKDINEDDRKKWERLIKKLNRIVYKQEQLDWDQLYQVMNKLQDGFYDRVHTQYPQLDTIEFRICCLSCEDFNDTEIAVVMNSTINMIQKQRSIIRKKINVPPHGNIHVFFREHLGNNAD